MTAPAGPAAGIDVGGTTIKALVLDVSGDVIAEERADTPHGDPSGQRVADAVAELTHRLGHVAAAGVAVPGVVDEDRGLALWSANLGFRNVPLRDLLQQRLDVPVAFGQDVRVGALAEARAGAAAGDRGPIVFLPIGTGVAAALVVHGRVVVSDGWAGEVGQLVLAGGRCAGRTVESVASAAAFARRTGESDARRAVARVISGDAAVQQPWEDAVAALGEAVAALVVSVAPTVVVIGGGLGQAGRVLLDPLAQELERRTAGLRQPRLVPARFGDLATARGAAHLAADAAGYSLCTGA